MSGCRPGAAANQARAFSLALYSSFQWRLLFLPPKHASPHSTIVVKGLLPLWMTPMAWEPGIWESWGTRNCTTRIGDPQSGRVTGRHQRHRLPADCRRSRAGPAGRFGAAKLAAVLATYDWPTRSRLRRRVGPRRPRPRPTSATPNHRPTGLSGGPTQGLAPRGVPARGAGGAAVVLDRSADRGAGGPGHESTTTPPASSRAAGSEATVGRTTNCPVFSVNYFCRLASTIFAGSGRRESRSTTMTPVGRVGVACDVQSGVENALPRRCTVAPLLGRVFHAAGAVHGLLGFRSIPAFRRSTVGGRGAAADPEHVPGGTGAAGISGGTGPCSSSGRRTQACSA